MNTNPNVKRILCFGDSLTYGVNPINEKRFDEKHRWTGILQDLLGANYEIIEEGLSGRTTNLDDEGEDDRNGLEYFKPCLLSSLPLFSVILLLGTNDLKNRFNRNSEEVAKAVEKYIEFINLTSEAEGLEKPEIIVTVPPLVSEKNVPPDWDFINAESRSKEFAKYYKAVADKNSCLFLDLSEIVNPSTVDGVHLDEKGNEIVAKNLYRLISNI